MIDNCNPVQDLLCCATKVVVESWQQSWNENTNKLLGIKPLVGGCQQSMSVPKGCCCDKQTLDWSHMTNAFLPFLWQELS